MIMSSRLSAKVCTHQKKVIDFTGSDALLLTLAPSRQQRCGGPILWRRHINLFKSRVAASAKVVLGEVVAKYWI